MKKKLIIALGLAMLVGCGQKNTEPEEPEATEETAPAESTSVWVSPLGSINASSVKVMEGFEKREVVYGDHTVLVDQERIGYPQEWFDTDYTCDAIIIETDGKHGIYDYSGKLLYEPTVNVHSTPFSQGINLAKIKNSDGSFRYAYGYCNQTISSAVVFEPDFKTVTDVAFDDYGFAPYQDESKYPFFAIVGGTFGVVTPELDDEGKRTGQYSFEAYSGTGLTQNAVVPVMDAMYKTASYVIVYQNGSIGPNVLEELGKYQKGSYANGYYRLKYDDTTIFIHATSATQIGWAYHDAKNFSGGYAPVKRYGYWAFINEEGEEVTDYVFSEVTGVYDGKAYVRVGRQWGIIDIAYAVNRGKTVAWTALFGSEKADSKGTLTVQVADLNFRSGAGTAYEALGNSVPGSQYPVYEITEGQGYTWYRIDEGVWLPSEGTWATYEEGVFTADEGPVKNK